MIIKHRVNNAFLTCCIIFTITSLIFAIAIIAKGYHIRDGLSKECASVGGDYYITRSWFEGKCIMRNVSTTKVSEK